MHFGSFNLPKSSVWKMDGRMQVQRGSNGLTQISHSPVAEPNSNPDFLTLNSQLNLAAEHKEESFYVKIIYMKLCILYKYHLCRIVAHSMEGTLT